MLPVNWTMCSKITSRTFGSLPQIHPGTRRSGWISEGTHKSLSNLQSLDVIRNSPHSNCSQPEEKSNSVSAAHLFSPVQVDIGLESANKASGVEAQQECTHISSEGHA